MYGRLVRADDDAPAPELLQLPDGGPGVSREREESHGVLAQQTPGLRERPVARCAIEQYVALHCAAQPGRELSLCRRRMEDQRLGKVIHAEPI